MTETQSLDDEIYKCESNVRLLLLLRLSIVSLD